MSDANSPWAVTREEIDALSVADIRRLRVHLLSSLNRADDTTAALFEPLLFLIERSIFARPADTLEILAAKIEIALVTGCENDPELKVVLSDAEAILGAST